MSRPLLLLLALGTTVLHAQVDKDLTVRATQTFEERPLSLDAEIEQKYSIEKQTLLNPLKIGLNYRTLHGAYRIGLGYSFTPQTGDHTVSLGVRFHLLSFGERR